MEVERSRSSLKWAEIAVDVICIIIPLIIPSMPIAGKAIAGFIAWSLFWHLLVTEFKSCEAWSLEAKLGWYVIITIYLVVFLTTPLLKLWRAERAGDTEGDLVPYGNPVGHTSLPPPIQFGEGGQPIAIAGMLKLYYDTGLLVSWGKDWPEITTTVRDKQGNEVAKIERNHWSTTKSCLDKNYTRDSLEVKDLRDHVVLQVKIFPDKVQLQGIWYSDTEGIEAIESPVPAKPGSVLYLMPKDSKGNYPNEYLIAPLFKYPSKDHWAELASK